MSQDTRRRGAPRVSLRKGRGSGRGGSRARVLDAASLLFSRKGYAATSVDEIASKANASPSSIYWHFKGGKDDILLAVVEEAARQHTDAVLSAVREGKTLSEKADIFLESAKKQMKNSAETMRLIMQMALERAGEDKEVRERIRGIFRMFRDTIVDELLAEFPALDPVILRQSATIQVGVFEGVFLQWQLDPEQVDLESVFAFLHIMTQSTLSRFGMDYGIPLPVRRKKT